MLGRKMRTFQRGDVVGLDDMQTIARDLEVLLDDLATRRRPTTPERPRTEKFYGFIVDAGPLGETDYNDYHYWVQLVTIKNDGNGDMYPDIDGIGNSINIVLAVNWAEVILSADGTINVEASTRSLSIGLGVVVEVVTTPTTPPSRFYFIEKTTPRIRVTLEVDGGDDGTVTTYPNYTYTATDSAGNQIGTGFNYGGARSKISTEPATDGVMVWAGGEWVLEYCNESIITGPTCPT